MKKRFVMLAAGIICTAGLFLGTTSNSHATKDLEGGYYIKLPCIAKSGNLCILNGNSCGLASRCR